MFFICLKTKIKYKANKANIKQTNTLCHTGGGISSSKGHGESSSTKVFTAAGT